MSRLPLALAGIAVAALVIYIFIFAKRDGRTDQVDSAGEKGAEVSRSTRPEGRLGTSDEASGRTNAGKRTTDSSISETGEDGPQFPLVDEILGNDKLSTGEAAARLLEIVNNADLSLLEREEALAHGLNLDLLQFERLVADPTLPQPLAQRFFDEMLNHNDDRALQVRTCVSLMDHEDPTMRQDAAEQLAFYIGLEERSDKPAELKQEAYAFLEELAKRPKSEPADTDAAIPETAPINPLQSEEEDEVTEEAE